MKGPLYSTEILHCWHDNTLRVYEGSHANRFCIAVYHGYARSSIKMQKMITNSTRVTFAASFVNSEIIFVDLEFRAFEVKDLLWLGRGNPTIRTKCFLNGLHPPPVT